MLYDIADIIVQEAGTIALATASVMLGVAGLSFAIVQCAYEIADARRHARFKCMRREFNPPITFMRAPLGERR